MLLPLLPSGPDGIRNTTLREAQQTTKLNKVQTEREGFEPSVGVKPTHAFQACALNRSATSPIFQEKNLHYLSPPLVNIKQRREFKFQRLQKHNYSHTNRR